MDPDSRRPVRPELAPEALRRSGAAWHAARGRRSTPRLALLSGRVALARARPFGIVALLGAVAWALAGRRLVK
jgi:hypothetical protein